MFQYPKTDSTIHLDIVNNLLNFAEENNLSLADIKAELAKLRCNTNIQLVSFDFVKAGVLSLRDHEWFNENYPEFQYVGDDDLYVDTIVEWLIDKMVEGNCFTLNPLVNPFLQMIGELYLLIQEWDTWSEFSHQCIAEAVCEYLSRVLDRHESSYDFDVSACSPY